MAVTDKLKEMVEELRQDLSEVKEQVKQLLPLGKSKETFPVSRQLAEHPVATLQRENNRLLADFLRGSMSPFHTLATPFGDLDPLGSWPRIDIDETNREIRVRADLAGMDQDDIDLSLHDGMLTIRGEKKTEDEDVGRHHYRRECFYGSFSRSVPLPAEIDPDGIKARMKRGVLQVTLPKLPEAGRRGRRIPISS